MERYIAIAAQMVVDRQLESSRVPPRTRHRHLEAAGIAANVMLRAGPRAVDRKAILREANEQQNVFEEVGASDVDAAVSILQNHWLEVEELATEFTKRVKRRQFNAA